jgi:hypothetical protein
MHPLGTESIVVEKENIVCIVGMHRSGTSMIARLLNVCGLDLGPAERLLKADATNPLGHFEHRGFLEIDRKLLRFFKATWREPPALQPGWHLDPKLESLRAEAKALVKTFAGKSSWGWKEPRASLFLPFWKEALPNMRFVICIRNPIEVGRSLEKRNKTPLRKGASLWYRYTRASIEDTEGCPRLFTFFEDYFDNGSAEIERLLRFCGLQLPGDNAQLNSAISTELRHHTSVIQSLLEEPAVTLECKLFYLGLRAILSEHPSCVEDRDGRSGHDAATVNAFVKLFQDGDESNAASDREAPPAELQSRSGDHRAATKLKRLLASLKRF